jgi:UDP-GlcNAc3NAcA epimerase
MSTEKKKIVIIIGARPQFIKHAAIELAMRNQFDLQTIHTGQHYDANMSAVFFGQLGISEPSVMLHIGGGNHGNQTGKMLVAIEEVLEKEKPDMVVVYGDTNSTLAGALAAAKLHIPVAHIEAGLRSYNKQMPEEINRVLTDNVSDLLFCPTQEAMDNLKKENICNNVCIVGDVMLDMIMLAQKKQLLTQKEDFNNYYFATIHRPYNTDDDERLVKIIETLQSLDKKVKFSVHPRTMHKLESLGVELAKFTNILILPPVGYFESLQLQYNANAVITDSGGVQKEAYILQKKCITLRSETEWVETLEGGWNHLVFENLNDIQKYLFTTPTQHNATIYGDGNAAMQITTILKNYLQA